MPECSVGSDSKPFLNLTLERKTMSLQGCLLLWPLYRSISQKLSIMSPKKKLTILHLLWNVTQIFSVRFSLMSSPVYALISAICVGEMRVQEHILVDSPYQAINIRCHLLIGVHQWQHNVQSLLSVSGQISPAETDQKRLWKTEMTEKKVSGKICVHFSFKGSTLCPFYKM